MSDAVQVPFVPPRSLWQRLTQYTKDVFQDFNGVGKAVAKIALGIFFILAGVFACVYLWSFPIACLSVKSIVALSFAEISLDLIFAPLAGVAAFFIGSFYGIRMLQK